MKDIILMIGIPGSGKSSYIDNNLLDYQLISTDDIKETIGGEFYTTWTFFNSNNKYREISAIDAVSKTNCESLMKRNRSIVIDDLVITENKIIKWTELADKYQYNKTAIIINKDLNLCIQRRPSFPINIIKELYEQFRNLLKNKELLKKKYNINFIEVI